MVMTAPEARIDLPDSSMAELRQRWKVRELALFGSVLRQDFRADSDVDVFVTFQPDAGWSLWDFLDFRAELSGLFGREVDLVSRGGLLNPRRREEILSNRRVVYAA